MTTPDLPYPISSEAEAFPWPDENKIRATAPPAEDQDSGFHVPNEASQSIPYPQSFRSSYSPYPTESSSYPYPPQVSSPYPPQGNTYPPQSAPYPPQSAPYPPQSSPYPPQSFPYPMQNDPYSPPNPTYPSQNTNYPPQSSPYPPQPSFYPPQNMPHSVPETAQYPGQTYPYPQADSTYGNESSIGSRNVNLNEMPGKNLLSGSKGLNKLLNTGMKMAEDALRNTNLSFPQSGRQSPGRQPSSPQAPNYPPPQPPSNVPTGNFFPKPFKVTSSSPKIKNFNGQNYDELKRSCLRSGSFFKDPDFPASNRLLVDDNSQFIFSYLGNARYDRESIEWLRPTEICRNPEMFVGDFDRFDINQGEIGNCWFLAALANLAENEKCFQRVVPMDQGFGRDYCGIFRFRFWRFGEWVEVVIDDRLPTRNGKLIYVRSVEKNEFWSALLEKAYAKLHGSYKALEGGLTIEAAVDFTGGIPEMIDMDRMKMAPERLFYIMSKADARGAFMGCALTNSPRAAEGQRKGLQSRHAYTITKVVEIRSHRVRGGIPLVRLRNPHGNHKEWRGDWSDGDRNWNAIPSHMRKELGLTYQDDGEFYMAFRDFLRYFGELEICHLTPESAEGGEIIKKFEVFNFYGTWRAGSTSGGCGNDGFRNYAMNPQFFINLNDPDPYDDISHCPVIISLMQRQPKRKSEHAIGFKVYGCDLGTTRLTEHFMARHNSVDRTDAFINLREISKRLLLPQGRYCIIPSTFRRGDEGDFLLRVFIEKSWGTSEQGRGEAVKDMMDGGHTHNRGLGTTSSLSGAFGGLDIGSSQDGRKKKSGRDKAIGYAFKILEKNFPEHAKGIKKLKDFYNWATDSESEFALLNNIVKSLKK